MDMRTGCVSGESHARDTQRGCATVADTVIHAAGDRLYIVTLPHAEAEGASDGGA